MSEARKIAQCSMLSALSVVVMIVGAVLGLGMYASPMLAGLILSTIGDAQGRKYQLLTWGATSALCLMLITNIEQNLMYMCLFGLYPILRPYLQKLPGRLRLIAKLLFFNIVVVALEALIMLVLVPETMGGGLMIALLFMGNITFLCYDIILPRAQLLLERLFRRIKHR